jgi:hypothetical protein
MQDEGGSVTLAIPCRTDEPSLAHTLAAAEASRRAAGPLIERFEVLVCVNGEGDGAGPRAAVVALARDARVPLVEVDADREEPPAGRSLEAPLAVVLLRTRRTGKAIAWNLLRTRARGRVIIFLDADVSFAADAFGILLAELAADPTATIASAKTTCAPRPGVFEGIMAAPYGVDFPNLSPQLYGARPASLPAAMPEDLIEPERWLELVVGRARLRRAPTARVVVRLPATLADFFRQRVRIEMGKVQLTHEYPGLDARGVPQPRARAALASLGAAALARLAAYLALRTSAHAVAWWRYRRGRTAGIWRQAVTTKRWDAA